MEVKVYVLPICSSHARHADGKPAQSLRLPSSSSVSDLWKQKDKVYIIAASYLIYHPVGHSSRR